MTAFKLDFPYNLLISAKVGKLEYNEDILVQNIIIKESLLFKLIKKVGSLWQVV